MGILTEAVIEQSAVKAAVFGPQGSSKSLTTFLIAIGLSKLHHDGAPIAMHDTEDASDWLVPIAQVEGVRFIRHKSTAFVDMVAVLKDAEENRACVYIQDVVSRTWKELQDSYMEKRGIKRLEFQHWNELKRTWQRYVDRYLASPLHCFVLGRLGYEYDAVEDSEGKRSQERVGTKMKAEGEFGYEPHLLLEMEGRRVIPPSEEGEGRKKKRRVRKQGGQFEYYAHVLKDRSRALNATAIRLPDVNNYKPGDYRKIYDLFAPHWALMNFGREHRGLDVDKSSASLFDSSDGGRALFAERQRLKGIALEEIKAMLVKVWPGQDADSKAAKQSAIKQLFGVYSWSSAEEKPAEEADRALVAMTNFVAQVVAKPPSNHDAAIELLAECRDAANDTFQPQIGVVAPEDAAVI
jgi:hypothetical protein